MRQVLTVIAAELGGELDSVAWHLLRYQDTQAVRAELVARYSPASANKALAALKGVLKEAFRLGLMDSESYQRAIDLQPARGSRALRGRALELSEIAALFAACKASTRQGARDAAVLSLCFGCGLRRAEASATQLADFDKARQAVTVMGKGNKQRLVFLNQQLALAVSSWIAVRGTGAGPLLFPVNKADRIERRQMTPEAVAVILKRLVKRTRLEPASPHDLRRTFVTQLLQNGCDLATAQALARHSSPATTVRYDRRGDDAQRRAVELLVIPAA